MGWTRFLAISLAVVGVTLATIALTFGAAGAVLAGLSFVQAVEPQIQWGNASEWFGAIGTVLAFVAGVVVIRRHSRWRRRDEARRRDELRKQQAELITGWWDVDTSELELINNSRGIVYHVVAVIDYELKPGHGLSPSNTYALNALPPGTKRESLH